MEKNNTMNKADYWLIAAAVLAAAGKAIADALAGRK